MVLPKLKLTKPSPLKIASIKIGHKIYDCPFLTCDCPTKPRFPVWIGLDIKSYVISILNNDKYVHNIKLSTVLYPSQRKDRRTVSRNFELMVPGIPLSADTSWSWSCWGRGPGTPSPRRGRIAFRRSSWVRHRKAWRCTGLAWLAPPQWT